MVVEVPAVVLLCYLVDVLLLMVWCMVFCDVVVLRWWYSMVGAVVLCYVDGVLCDIVLCYVVAWYVILFCVMLWCDVWWHFVLCCGGGGVLCYVVV